jgi:hypothetical protein
LSRLRGSRYGAPVPTPSDAKRTATDVLVAALLWTGTIAYLALWPRDLKSDEGLFLYEAKRLLDGDVLYRDVFEIVTPLAWYAMALLFRGFGADIATARMGMAVLHGGMAALVYAVCRRAGVRPNLALAAGVAHVAIAQPGLFVASPHWFGTLATLVLLLALLALEWPRRTGACVGVGLAAGLLLGVQQHKGAILALGAAAVMAVHALLGGLGWRRLARQLAAYAVGVALVVVPLALWLVASAGAGPVFEALVVFPLVNYRDIGFNRPRWGEYVPIVAHWLYVLPELIRWLPLVSVVPLARLALPAARRDPITLRRLSVLGVIGVFTVLSVGYAPNYTRLAIVSPVLFVIVAETLEWGLGLLPQPGMGRAGGWALSLGVLAGLAVKLEQNLTRHRELIAATRPTAFGTVDFWNADEAVMVDRVRELMRQDGARELFCYPNCAGVYLTTGAVNPTPFQILLPTYNSPAQIAHALELLDARRVPYVVVALPLSVKWAEDPMVRWLGPRYERVPLPLSKRIPGFMLFRRKAEQPPS